jgi:hypothetical protein
LSKCIFHLGRNIVKRAHGFGAWVNPQNLKPKNW